MSEITEEFKTWWETSLHEASFRKNHLPYPPPDSTLWWAKRNGWKCIKLKWRP